ncbi:hypothetical protein FQA39_LY16637 [Lamprigera yunnana]|nr:hypothetical protein FQA39_LY16637 [Lamprigera yunnana]
MKLTNIETRDEKVSEAHFGEEDYTAVDKEWEEFSKLLQHRTKEKRAQAFYPCPPPEDDDEVNNFMYGRYSRQLGEFAKLEALKQAEKRRIKEEKARKKELRGYQGKLAKTFTYLWKHTFAKLGEDWVFLALLGIIMAILSYIMDKGIGVCGKARIWLYRDITDHPVLRYFAWATLPVCLILFSAGFVHLIAPQSIGSGIPEMKTILRGVALKEYLTFRTLVAKVIGLTATLGSGMPLGKEGPFVHIASIVATLLSKLVTGFQGIYENESRNTEMLAAACAVGVASCFAAPVGGVLFSIEVTTVYFAVRNYWRGFFAAVCGATVFRLLSVWFEQAATVTAFFKTNFAMDFPFDPQELFVFALIGVISGLGGAFYVWVHRRYVMFMRKNKTINSFLQKNRFLYPAIVSLLVATVSFPLGLGQFMAGDLNSHDQVSSLFSNFIWTSKNLTVEEQDIIEHWETPYSGVYVSLGGFIAFTFIFSIISSTIPVPSGSFIPVFKIGAALGRIVGELMHMWFASGMNYGGRVSQIVPGGYATVGAAAFSGAVTHTISVSVIVFEMTGQITHIIPIMIAVLISNAIASLLFPSMYDSIILIKKLPYLPDFLPSSSRMYNICVEDFMMREVKYIYERMTYEQLKTILKENKRLKSFPLVDNPENMVLLGSIQRIHLIDLIEQHIGRERRLQVAAIRHREALAREEKKKAEERQRRPSRFHVSPAPDMLALRQMSENQLNIDPPPYHHPVFGTQPKKSILKKTNSFTLKGFSPLMATSPGSTPYTTVTGAESRIRLAFEAIFRKSAQLQDVDNSETQSVLSDGSRPEIIPISPTNFKKVQLPKERVCDMSTEDQRKWEDEEMELPVEFSTCSIDPAPFQLVERTSLLKVHSLFSMVGVNHAYVTAIGKLIGVVGLTDLRKAIEDVNSGYMPVSSIDINKNVNNNDVKDCSCDDNETTAALMCKDSEV